MDYYQYTKLNFVKDENGHVVKAIITYRGQEMIATRCEVDVDLNQIIVKISGHYYSHALGTVCTIKEMHGQLYLSHRRYDDILLHCIDANRFVSAWGFISFQNDASGRVLGFHLTEELFGFKPILFTRIPINTKQKAP
jgi:hypothetical protein